MRAELPGGTVTFVFTDIEGSTRLIRRLEDRYVAVLDRHNEILRDAFQANGGHEVNTEGDSLLAAFDNRDAAVRACALAQRRLQDEPWPPDATVRVRMGVHSGLAWPHGNDYVAYAVHQAARVVDAAHGGQVLVTEQASQGMTSTDDVELVSLGHYRVRDFDEPVELLQLVGPGLWLDFPAPRVVPADRHNLARPLTALVGRQAELDELDRLVVAAAALTIVGAGGVGKTRLAIEYGLNSLDQWPDGVWFVDLAATTDPELIPSVVATALGIRVVGADSLRDVLDELEQQAALLILDNAEQARHAVAKVVAAIVANCSAVAVVTTSREALGLRAERVWRLEPLAAGGTEEHRGADRAQPAVELFLQRAAERSPRWLGGDGLDPARHGEVAELCRRLDGLPLAIEMAAARADVMDPREMLTGLDRHSRLLAIDDPTLYERQRSLDRTLEWSDALLVESERVVLRRLGVFAGTFGHETASAAVADELIHPTDVPEILWSLASKSLISAEPAAGATRYRLLHTVRAFVRRRCPHDDAVAVMRRLASWYLERIGPGVQLGRAWLGMMADEIDNVRSLIADLAGSDDASAQRLAWSIGQYYDAVQLYPQGVDELSRWVEVLTEATPDRVGLLTLLAFVRLRVVELDAAAATLNDATLLRNSVGPAGWDDIGVERTAGELALRSGDADGAAALAQRVLDAGPSARGAGRMYNLLGLAQGTAGNFPAAAAAFLQELATWERLGVDALMATAHGNVAETLIRLGDLAEGARHQLACLDIALQIGQPASIAFSLIVAARTAASRDRWLDAVEFHTVAETMLAEVGDVLYPQDRQLADELLAAARAALGDELFERQQRFARQVDRGPVVERAAAELALASEHREETIP